VIGCFDHIAIFIALSILQAIVSVPPFNGAVSHVIAYFFFLLAMRLLLSKAALHEE
jgi:uncharacterized membrane protein